MKIRDHVEVVAQPTVVRLDQLQAADAEWISRSYYITEETNKHFKALKVLLSKKSGSGMFLVGHYGCGKSHFLAYLAQQIQSGNFSSSNPTVVPLSLLNYNAAQTLESILDEALAITHHQKDRREAWKQIQERYPSGLFLILDELSEFLRSKATTKLYNEDLRFLQFLGEWAQAHPLWILASLQEQIEHTGDMEYDLYRKIKDRYPVRFLLTTTHVKDLIGQRILHKGPFYRPAVQKLAKDLKGIYPAGTLDYADFCEIYPIHPITLELLEEVRDRFSQARGIVDFTLTQLLGSEARGVAPFLDQPWGHLITPDRIVDHFSDLFEVQPEFLAIAQKALPYFRKNIPLIFEKEAQRELAWRLLKLLVLVHLSPRRKFLNTDQAGLWLLFKVSTIDPAKNREVITHVLDALTEKGAFLKRSGTHYRLDLEDDSKENLDQQLAREIEELSGLGDAIFEELVPCLKDAEFNPFSLPRDRWHTRKVKWHFHDRDIQIYFGGGAAPDEKGLALQIGVPWGPAPQSSFSYQIVPKTLELTPDILELAALFRLLDRPLPARVLSRIRERIAGRAPGFASLVRVAYAEATVFDPTGVKMTPPLGALQTGLAGWLNAYGEWILKLTYPQFERFAPGHGPLPKEAYRHFMKFATEQDLTSEIAPDSVKLIREAYLVPMGLMQRRGAEYSTTGKLENHDLVRLIAPMIEHHPSPARVYEHLGAPVYGLVHDQVHLLLLFLLIQGEIDIVKGQHSYRETYETLFNPLQYDRLIPGHALNLEQLRELEILCEGFRLPTPRQWSVLAQKRAIEQLRKYGSRQRDQLSAFLMTLGGQPDCAELVAQVEKVIGRWLALEKGDHELQGFQHFLYEIGAAQPFIAEAGDLTLLPSRFEKLLREGRRFRHVFGYPSVAGCPDPDVAARMQALGPPPSLSDPERLETWLNQAQTVFERYQNWYRRRHEEWRDAVNRHSVWSYRIPTVAGSRHAAQTDLVRELEALKTKAMQLRCPGLSSLDFQPICRCGFDGEEAPLSDVLRRFDERMGRLESQLSLFFQQEKVIARVREWVDQKMEVTTQTLSYLEGKSCFPEVENLALFDQHLAGIELVQAVDENTLAEFVAERVWERDSLLQSLDQFLARFGPRFTFKRDARRPRRDLLAWCCEQALRHGHPLPAFSLAEQSEIAEVIRPEWIGEESIQQVERMGLGEAGICRVLELLLDGTVPLPKNIPSSGPVAAAVELLKPPRPVSADDLGGRAAVLYDQNERFVKLRPQQWLTRLQDLAQSPLELPDLEDVLRSHLEAQWIVVDCLGVPLLKTAREVLLDCFFNWRLGTVEFSMVSRKSSTDRFYLGLLDQKLNRAFEKINSVDELIHNGRRSFDSLVRRARSELEIAFKRIVGKLNPLESVVVFGDHGFRMNPEGSGFMHGGSSTLERVTPVFVLSPRK